MFRVQFSGGSKEQALEHCCSCVQKLAQYVTVQVPDAVSQELRPGPGPLRAGESPGEGCAQRVPPQQGVSRRVWWLREKPDKVLLRGAKITVEFVESGLWVKRYLMLSDFFKLKVDRHCSYLPPRN